MGQCLHGMGGGCESPYRFYSGWVFLSNFNWIMTTYDNLILSGNCKESTLNNCNSIFSSYMIAQLNKGFSREARGEVGIRQVLRHSPSRGFGLSFADRLPGQSHEDYWENSRKEKSF